MPARTREMARVVMSDEKQFVILIEFEEGTPNVHVAIEKLALERYILDMFSVVGN